MARMASSYKRPRAEGKAKEFCGGWLCPEEKPGTGLSSGRPRARCASVGPRFRRNRKPAPKKIPTKNLPPDIKHQTSSLTSTRPLLRRVLGNEYFGNEEMSIPKLVGYFLITLTRT
jgi:hypothetical protein